MNKYRISIIIPAKNEAATIKSIIKDCQKYADELIVIDGHSIDNTCSIAKSLGAKIYLDHGLGKGEAIRLAITKAKGDIIVFIDADGSHDPRDIPKLIKPIIKDKFDHVTASRSLGGSDELHGDFHQFIRLIGSEIITLGINYRFNVRLTDSQNGFRAIKTTVARQLNLQENSTTIEQEMIIKTLKKGFRLTEIPSHEYRRQAGQSKVLVHILAHKYFYSWLKYLFFQ